MNWSNRGTAVLLSLLPGWGHIYLGREGPGLLVFTAAAVGVFALFNGLFVYFGELRGTVIGISAIAASGVLIYSVSDVLRLTAPSRVARLRHLRDRLLWEGTLAFLRSDLLLAEQRFLDCARLDGLDAEPVFRAGVAAARRGADTEARRLLRRARKLDVELKWQWELGEELAAVERRLSGAAEDAGAGAAEAARGEVARRGFPVNA